MADVQMWQYLMIGVALILAIVFAVSTVTGDGPGDFLINLLNRLASVLKWLVVIPLWLLSNFELLRTANIAEQVANATEVTAYAKTAAGISARIGKEFGSVLGFADRALEGFIKLNDKYVYGSINLILPKLGVQPSPWLDETIVIGFALVCLVWNFSINSYDAVMYAEFLKKQEKNKSNALTWEQIKIFFSYHAKFIYYLFQEGDFGKADELAFKRLDDANDDWSHTKTLSEKTSAALASVMWGFFRAIAMEFALNLFFLFVQVANYQDHNAQFLAIVTHAASASSKLHLIG